jgi:hypothetical protein
MLNLCCIVTAILKMTTGRNFSMSGINSGHHYLPTYNILMIFQLCGKGGQSHILRGSMGVGVTIESYGKVEISYINVDNF